jgi:hypothetical protein
LVCCSEKNLATLIASGLFYGVSRWLSKCILPLSSSLLQEGDFWLIKSKIEINADPGQGCQMVYFHTKNPNFLKALKWKIWEYVMAIMLL